MDAVQQLKTLAGTRWNPYFVAYAIDTGAANPDEAIKRDGNNAGFLCWNTQRWVETRKRLGLKSSDPAGHHVDEHLNTLAARLGNKLTVITQAAA